MCESKYRASILVLLGMLFAAPWVSADDYHYVNMLVGDRAFGLGGAYTAIADDPAGLFYNPAGIIYAPGSSLSASMNSYYTSNTTYKNVLGGVYDWKRSSGSLLPNFFGMIQPFGKGMIGFSYAVPNSIVEDQDQIFKNITTTLGTANKFIINFNNTDNTYNFGPSYAYKYNDKISLGGTLYLHYRHQQRISNTLLIYTGDRVWSNEYFEVEEFGIKPIFGLTWSPVDQLAIGATISKTILITSDITSYQACLGANSGSYSADSLCQTGNSVLHAMISSSAKGTYPINITTGAAWFVNESLLLSMDLSLYTAHGNGADAREAMANIALGSEYYINPKVALRAGLFTDFSNTPKLKADVSDYNQLEHIDLYGMSFSISHFTRNSSLTLGFSYSFGGGKAQIVSGDTTLQDADVENLGIYLAASYAY